MAGTRLLLENSIDEEFTRKLAERFFKLGVGMPLDKVSDMGAMIHEDHMISVLDHIETVRKEGARVSFGGERLKGAEYDGGNLIAPTVLGNVTLDMMYFREEVFGPVISVKTFYMVDEAVTLALANDAEYGLGNGIWTNDIDKAHQVSKRLQSGTVWVNTFLAGAPRMPFVGYKRSGLGREDGKKASLNSCRRIRLFSSWEKIQGATAHSLGAATTLRRGKDK